MLGTGIVLIQSQYISTMLRCQKTISQAPSSFPAQAMLNQLVFHLAYSLFLRPFLSFFRITNLRAHSSPPTHTMLSSSQYTHFLHTIPLIRNGTMLAAKSCFNFLQNTSFCLTTILAITLIMVF